MAKKKGDDGASGLFPLPRVRNIGIIAHIDAGKTTTTEQVLYYTGAQHRIGSVDEGNTKTDFDSQEAERGITIFSAAVTSLWTPTGGETHQINIIDTPGHIDFTAEVERSLRVLDGAVVVFCGVAGVQAQSETVWRQADRHRVPRLAYVNKLDRSGASFFDAITSIEERLPGMRAIPVKLPLGEEKEFHGVVDLVEEVAWTWSEGDPPPAPVKGPIPEDAREMAELYREQLIERLAELDPEIEGLFLEEQTPSPAQLQAALRRVTVARTGFPVLAGASFKHKGIQPLLDAICHYLPSPLDRPPIQGKKPKGGKLKKAEDEEAWVPDARPCDAEAPFSALAFKTVSGKTSDLTFLRIYSGLADRQTQLLNVRENKKERLGGGIFRLDAKSRIPIEEARAGDVIGVVGLRYTRTGDTLCDNNHPILLESISFPLPVVSMAVEPRSSADADDLQKALQRMSKDDPTFTVRVDSETGQTVISGMGELHLEVIAERLRREERIEAKVGQPRVSYKQTVKGTARASGVYELEQGDKHIFGEVTLEVSPLPKAPGGVQVDFTLSEEVLPEQYHPAVLDGIKSKAMAVGDWSDPLIDVRVRVVGARWDPETAHESAYTAAASRALEQACEDAGLVSLEPVMTLAVEAPDEFFGTVIQDLQSRRADVLSTTQVRDRHRIVAAVPLKEVFGYAGEIRGKTQGRAEFSLEPRDYAPVPEGKRPKLF